MPRVALRPSRFVADLLRKRRQHLGLTLRQVEERARAVGSPIPFSTLARVEQGKVDPGIRRLHALLRVYDLPIEAAGDVLDLEMHAQAAPATKDPAVLRKEALEAWQAGDTGRAMARLAAYQETVGSDSEDPARRHDGLLTFAVLASKLGKNHLARVVLDHLLLEGPDRSILPRVLIQQAVTWSALGSTEAALAFLLRAEELYEGIRVSGSERARSLAWLNHQRASIQIDREEFSLAEASLAEAIKGYEHARDLHGKGLALLSWARLEYQRGSAKEAMAAARKSKQFAEKHGFERNRIVSLIEEGRAHGLAKKWEPASELLRDALSAALKSGDNGAQFYAHFHLWKAYTELGQPDLAAVSRNAAEYFVRFVDDRSREADEIRASLADRIIRPRPSA